MTVEDARIRMVVVDRDPMFALGLCSLIEKRPHIRASACDLADLTGAGPFTAGDMADIVLLDPAQFDLSPAALAQRVKVRFAGRGMIAYTVETGLPIARACLSAGFRGILPRSAGLEPLMAAIAAVKGGATCIDPSFATLFEPVAANRPQSRSQTLTDREAYVLESVAFGKSLKEIGLELALSSKTIETYKARGSSKLNLQGRRAIVEYAIRSGWVKAEAQLA